MERTLEIATATEAERTDPDHDALCRVDAGDVTGAVQLLMRRHGARVYRYCRAQLHDAMLADDVQQTVFVQVLRDLPRFRRKATVRSWILKIAHHRVLDAAKARRRAALRVSPAPPRELDAIVDEGPGVASELDDARLRAVLGDLLAALDEPARTALVLRYQQGLRFEEMAEILGEKSGTLQARVQRALPRLRAMIDRALRAPR